MQLLTISDYAALATLLITLGGLALGLLKKMIESILAKHLDALGSKFMSTAAGEELQKSMKELKFTTDNIRQKQIEIDAKLQTFWTVFGSRERRFRPHD